MQLYIIRHGLTDYNVGESRFRGQLDIPLSNLGIEQAERIATALKTVPLDTVYFSMLSRAKETAKIIIKFHPNAKFIEEPSLLTLNFGDWQGKFHKDIFETPEEKKLWDTNPNVFLIPNGETFYQVLDRVHRLFLRLCDQAESHIALITHRVVIICMLLYLFKLDPSHFLGFQG
ncbi:MAG: histidine phosphatase family protein [Candidatus Hodarchaeota archaeon]